MQNQQQRPSAIINPKYCAPYNVDLVIVRKVLALADSFSVTDVNGKMVFNLSASLMTLHDHRVLVDAAGEPVVTLHRKVWPDNLYTLSFDIFISSYCYFV